MASQPDLITLNDPASPISEAYRTLRMNLQFAALDQHLNSLLITSSGPNEGKSTTLANLAVTMAQIEQRVIMVDCDLRRPSLHELFGLSNDSGLTNMMLNEQVMENPPLQKTAVDGLRLLTSGPLPPRPSDLLGSKRMTSVISLLGQEADILLLDAPPIMAATDALVLATRVDAVLIVVSAGMTKREQAQQAIERLNRVNAHVIGSVLNNAPIDAFSRTY